MSENGGYTGKVYSVDNMPRAIEATKMNSQIFGLGDRLTTLEFDLADLYGPPSLTDKNEGLSSTDLSFYKRTAKELGLPGLASVDLILCNPPWVDAAHLRELNPLDNGVYDPELKFLNAALNFARVHLDPTNGEMLLLYSDLGSNLGL